MKRKWLIGIGVVNFLALLFATASFMVDFAILTPAQLQYDIGNAESVKAAIFQAQSQGIEMMRSSALSGGATLALIMLLNFIALCVFRFRSDP